MNQTSKGNATFSVEAVHPIPEEAYKMPYAPAVKIVGVSNSAGAIPLPLNRQTASINRRNACGCRSFHQNFISAGHSS